MFTRNRSGKKAKIRKEVPVTPTEKRWLESPWDPQWANFRGFDKFPRVQLSRIDITPQLKKAYYDKVTEKCLQTYMTQNAGSLHVKRLVQKCEVNIQRQDLWRLKTNLSHGNMSISPGSDNSINKDKSVMEEQPNGHNKKYHTPLYTPNHKSLKQVSFSEYVTVHHLEEFFKCSKCSEIFADYKLLKKHAKLFHRNHAAKQFTIESISKDSFHNINNEKNESRIAIDNNEESIMEETNCKDDVKRSVSIEKSPRNGKKKNNLDEKHPTSTAARIVMGPNSAEHIKIQHKTAEAGDAESRKAGKEKGHISEKKLRKTTISEHQCQFCCKYYSTRYGLRRHIETQHGKDRNLPTCKTCEETFAWQSLLESHKCIRLSLPEMPFQDCRPEVYFDNLQDNDRNGFNYLQLSENENYVNVMPFEIPVTVVNPTEGQDVILNNEDRFAQLSNLGYKIITQEEVPIEF